MSFTEIPASQVRKGDIIDLVHEVVSVRRNNAMGWLVVKTNVIDQHAHRVGTSRKTLYPHETVMRTDPD